MIFFFEEMYGPVAKLDLLSYLFLLVSIVPHFAVVVRRLHDTDRTGWWFLIGLVPLIGQVWFVILMCMNGTSGNNRFGPNPKTAS